MMAGSHATVVSEPPYATTNQRVSVIRERPVKAEKSILSGGPVKW